MAAARSRYHLRNGPRVAPDILDAALRLDYVDIARTHPALYDSQGREKEAFKIVDLSSWSESWAYATRIYKHIYLTLGPSLDDYRADVENLARKAGKDNWLAIYEYDRRRRTTWANNLGVSLATPDAAADRSLNLRLATARGTAATTAIKREREWASI
ncbi:hypothetical protein HDU86_007412, partial [Geranomyces michiganensis]